MEYKASMVGIMKVRNEEGVKKLRKIGRANESKKERLGEIKQLMNKDRKEEWEKKKRKMKRSPERSPGRSKEVKKRRNKERMDGPRTGGRIEGKEEGGN